MIEISEAEIRAWQMEFRSEATERLDSCEEHLLDKALITNTESLKDFKRLLHGLKGSSNAVGLSEFATLVHGMETQLQESPLTVDLVNALLTKIDTLRDIVSKLAA